MTCIAWDGRHLVADGQTTLGDQIATLDYNKLHRVAHPTFGLVVAGMSGVVSYWTKWLKGVESDGFDADVADMDLAAGIFVTRDGDGWEAQPNGTYERLKSYSAIGSGATLAYTVLRDGGSAIDAVKFACRHSISCGGVIRVYDPAANVVVKLR